MKRIILLLAILFSALTIHAAGSPWAHALGAMPDTVIVSRIMYDSLTIDSIAMQGITYHHPTEDIINDNQQRFRPVKTNFVKFFERFSKIDTTYIEPQKYNYAFMVQNTNTYEVYRLSNNDNLSVTFAPEWSYKIGPYFGWRWIFLGYTLDINHLDFTHDDSQRQELDLSLYTNLFGIDLYYRKSGDDYKIRRIELDNVDTKPLRGSEFHGFRSSVKGFNIYYILNHHKFSYPAAFSQSTVQRKSAGSPLLGFAYTDHNVSVDWTGLQEIIDKKLGPNVFTAPVDTNYRTVNVKYLDISLSGGYAYNWVFAKNWLLSATISVALAYKHSYGRDNTETIKMRKGFSVHNLGIDGIGRFGLVYNNMKWYCGLSATLNAFNYNKSNFSLNTFFGNLNFYVGFNFGYKKDS